jgi:DnaJ-class molecular chaperone
MVQKVKCDVCVTAFITERAKGVTYCTKCQANGWWWPTNDHKVRCDQCGGTGYMRCPKCLGSGVMYIPD